MRVVPKINNIFNNFIYWRFIDFISLKASNNLRAYFFGDGKKFFSFGSKSVPNVEFRSVCKNFSIAQGLISILVYILNIKHFSETS